MSDSVNSPDHYNWHPSGVECADIAAGFDYLDGNVIKYIWRAGKKQEQGMDDSEKQLEDYKKARWYIEKKIKTLEASHGLGLQHSSPKGNS